MKKITEHLFELNTIAGIQKRFLTVDLFKSVGRGGEVVFSTYDTMFWDYDNEECVTDWTQIKVSKTTEIVRSPDREWTIDWFNCFGCCLNHWCWRGKYTVSLGRWDIYISLFARQGICFKSY